MKKKFVRSKKTNTDLNFKLFLLVGLLVVFAVMLLSFGQNIQTNAANLFGL